MMSYIDAFVVPVPVDRETYRAFAEKNATIFRQHGATRVVEGWSDDVPHGKATDFYRSVQATEEEAVVFAWIEWPDKATRDAGMAKVMQEHEMQADAEPMPFDGKRLIFGGFATIVDA